VVLGQHLTGEADVTAMHVEKLISTGVSQEDIAVISPYNLQVATVFCVLQLSVLVITFFLVVFRSFGLTFDVTTCYWRQVLILQLVLQL